MNDEAPSLTQLSNGMLAVGSVSDQFGAGDQDPTWTLIDQNTGARLGFASTGFTFGDDTQTSIAAMNNGQVGAFFTTASDVVGQVL